MFSISSINITLICHKCIILQDNNWLCQDKQAIQRHSTTSTTTLKLPPLNTPHIPHPMLLTVFVDSLWNGSIYNAALSSEASVMSGSAWSIHFFFLHFVHQKGQSCQLFTAVSVTWCLQNRVLTWSVHIQVKLHSLSLSTLERFSPEASVVEISRCHVERVARKKNALMRWEPGESEFDSLVD